MIERSEFCRMWSRQLPNVIAVLLTIVVTGASYFAFFDSNNPRVLKTELRDADGNPKRVFEVGEVVYAYREICVDRVTTGDIDIEIQSKFGGTYWFLGSRAAAAKKGCYGRTSINQLPRSLPAGTYELRATAQYNINPFRVVTYEYPTVEFEVTR